MMRFAPKVTARMAVLLALCMAGLVAATCLPGVFKTSAAGAGAHSAAARAASPLVAPLAGPVIDVDRTDDTAAAAACTAAPSDCSLRGAVGFANNNAGTTINVPAGTYQLTIAGNSEQSAATGDLDVLASGTSIVGAGAGVTIIEQTTNDRVLDSNPLQNAGFTFSLSGVTIKGGNLPNPLISTTSRSGGGLLSGGPGATTNVTDCVFDTNQVTGTLAANGGAIADSTNTGTTTLNVTNCVFRNNSAATGAGGAIRFNSPGTLNVTRSLFVNNRALTNSGGAVNATGVGAGGTYNISRSAFVNNQAGGGASRGGALLIGNGVANISYSRFAANTAGAHVGEALARSIGALGGVTANNNWWGANSGPGTADVVNVLVGQWLQLRLSASPSSISTGGTSTLTADIYGSSSGGVVAAANLAGLPAFPDPAAPVFANPTPALGTISGATTQFVDGQATATYTAGNTGGTDDVTATADGQTVSTTITIGEPPTVNCPTDITVAGDPNTCSASVAFNTTATGFPAPAVTCQIGAQVITSPHVFPAGTTAVTCTATNGIGQDASCTFNVIVTGSQSPTVLAPPAVTATTGASATSCSVFISDATLGTATAANTCSGAVTITRTGVPAGNIFPVGTTTITYTGTDPAGHTGTATQTVTVTDTTRPTVTAPAPTTGSADTSCQAAIPNVVPGVSAADNCTPAGSLTITQSPAAGTLVGLGPHTITVTVTDGAGNSSTATTTFTVNDTTPPTIFAPANATYECASQVPGANPAQASAADNCSTPSVTVSETTNGGAGTSASPLVITRTYTATDGAGNQASAAQTITVVDHTAPTVSAPAPSSAAADASCQAAIPNVVAGSTATDNCGGGVTITQSPAAGTLVGPGTHTITVTATDAGGNSSTATTTFTVNDTTPPTVIAPAPASASADANCLAAIPNVVAGSSASDSCAGPVTLSQSPAAGTLVGLGTHTITVTAIDAAGNNSTATTIFTVNDTTPPAINAPADVSVSTPASATSCSAFVSDAALGTATASDNCSGSVPVTRTGVPAGNIFPVGTTTITYTATDAAGNSSTRTQTVTVRDATPPVITLNGANPMTVECHTGFSDPGATATDNCGGSVAVSVAGAVNLNVPGTYTITYTAQDAAGNQATPVTRTVNVVDTTAPVITLNGQAISLWPPDHSYHTMSITDLVASVSDSCNTSLGVSSVVISKVTSDELEDMTQGGDGATLNDIVIAADCKSVQLRAERDGNGNGRVYTITLRVTDASGNVGTATATVTVRKDKDGAAAVDDGPHYTVTSNCP
ncbi:MAG TPA: HYR domain-containing protein [Pyrinomonadaceae bacterium]|jgi:hypothetical protein